ncbi:hypothetical protein LMH87_010890 [Akanthomyces muscarius]|uniref:ABC transporter domain-containing protein n=1 Tax=Akanthomyces muscarius TaxID=2231603 RepID=A0A9W8UKK2_AKAMU|nr:hypothetical protein LMH87_010890 [Akanthomyces muscarius]KAJ4150125.1 hypothetical protein LMH87_010890 [Akanthomyces muscarius]
MEDVHFKSRTGREILKRVHLDIPAASLTMIHGTVGSGKSIFLQLLLGVIKPSKGNVSVLSKEISLAAQKPWIQNQTIRENVIGLSPVDEFLSKEIIYGCALGVDILEFPSGDQKMAGTDGCNLSGRQKQRLGLARSLYLDLSIIILDDVLSAFDTPTAAAIFSRLLGPDGILRRCGTTWTFFQKQRGADLLSLPENGAAPTASISNGDAAHFHGSEEGQAPVKSKTASPGSAVEKSRRNGNLSLYAYLFRSAGPIMLSAWIFSTAFASVGEKVPKIFVKISYSEAPDNDTYFAGFAVTAFASIIITAATALSYFALIVPNLSNELHWRLLELLSGLHCPRLLKPTLATL